MELLVVQDHLERGRFGASQGGACGDLLECQLESLWRLATWPRRFLETMKEEWRKVSGSTPKAASRGTVHHWHVLLRGSYSNLKVVVVVPRQKHVLQQQ